MRRRMMMQTEGDENMKDYKLIKTIHLAEDAQGISFSFNESYDELYIIGTPISDGINKSVTLFKNEHYAYGQNIFTLSDILSNSADGTSFFSMLLKKVPGNVIALCLYNKHNNSVGKNYKITSGYIESYPWDKFTRIDLAVWSEGSSGLFKAGSDFEIYGR